MTSAFDTGVKMIVHGILAEDADSKECAEMSVQAGIDVLRFLFGDQWTFNYFANITDQLADCAIIERDKQMAELKRGLS